MELAEDRVKWRDLLVTVLIYSGILLLSYQPKLRRVPFQKSTARLTNHKLMERILIKRFSVKLGKYFYNVVWPSGDLLITAQSQVQMSFYMLTQN
jgi:hypothetical protein